MDDSKESVVEYGENGLDKIATGLFSKFVDGGDAKHSQFIHKVGFCG